MTRCCGLRFHRPEIRPVVVRTEGDPAECWPSTTELYATPEHWFAREVLLHQKRVLKRLEGPAPQLLHR